VEDRVLVLDHPRPLIGYLDPPYPMDLKSRLLRELASRGAGLSARRCLVGFDGFVDSIVSAVAQRSGQGENFTPFSGIAEFGRSIQDAAGKSANFELYPRMEKLGGNGPIMAGALLAMDANVTCVGAFGRGSIHPVFADLARQARLVSLAEPARTTAIEFPDGKIMLGVTESLDQITPANLTAAFGGDGFRDAIAEADLVVLGNWTMIPHMTEIYTELTERLLPGVPAREDRLFFFDLADPGKRSRADLLGALGEIARFERFGRVCLGLNLREAQQVSAALDLGADGDSPEGLRSLASKIRSRLELTSVVVHPTACAVCATRAGSCLVDGPYTAQPLISTGAGDHFNAGFVAGQLLGLGPESCLCLGVSASGLYVRTGRSPTVADVENFLVNWR
jgi:sugar/nucleoside kinase (ribokinase family)